MDNLTPEERREAVRIIEALERQAREYATQYVAQFPIPETGLTPAQRKALEYLRLEILLNDGNGRYCHKYEYMQWEVKVTDYGTVYLYVVTGHKTEHSIGRLFPTRRHIAIGRRGGMKLLNARNKSESTGRDITWYRVK